MHDDAPGTNGTNSQIKSRTSMLKESLSDYSDANILVKETITTTVAGIDTAAGNAGRRNKSVTFQYYPPSDDCVNKVSNTHNHSQDI